jgi:uncharacterized SAM-binding protein YcdF (DUF218 family)
MFLFKIIRTVFWLGVFAFIGGFFYFVNLVPNSQSDRGDIITDAAVVLTGGKMRIEEGLNLLEEGKTRRVFISGVGSDKLIQQIRNRTNIININKIELGKLATSTRGNALETKAWLRKNNIKTISLVTANYHMPRSLLEFRHYLDSDVEIIPHPSFTSSFHRKEYWLHVNSIKILLLEYCKTLLFLYEKNLVK